VSGPGEASSTPSPLDAFSERAFSPVVDAASAARSFALGIVGPDDARCDDVALVVSELASNAVLHARTPFSVRLRIDATGRIRVEVRDASAVQPTRRRYSADAVTGRGLRIIEACTDRWGVEAEADGKVVWCELDARVHAGGGVRARHE
jgi:anti-sigma regulatory factor (Ser/Thr protein kinase)